MAGPRLARFEIFVKVTRRRDDARRRPARCGFGATPATSELTPATSTCANESISLCMWKATRKKCWDISAEADEAEGLFQLDGADGVVSCLGVSCPCQEFVDVLARVWEGARQE